MINTLSLKWSTLSKVGNSKIFKTSFIWLFLIPLIAKIFHKIEEISFTFNDKLYVLDLTLSFSFQMLFFSAVFATFGQIIYSIYAPLIISSYASYNEFKEEGKGKEQLKIEYVRLLENINNLSSFDMYEHIKKTYTNYGNNQPISDSLTKRNESKKNALLEWVDEFQLENNKQSEFFWHIRDEIDNINLLPRFFITIFYMLSFLSLGLIAIENIYYVTTQSNLNIFQFFH